MGSTTSSPPTRRRSSPTCTAGSSRAAASCCGRGPSATGSCAPAARSTSRPTPPRSARDDSWRVPEPPEDLRDRRVEITGPTDERTATLIVRPRGWHLEERHLRVAGEPVAGALLDFGLFFHHCARRLVDHGSGPYLYLP